MPFPLNSYLEIELPYISRELSSKLNTILVYCSPHDWAFDNLRGSAMLIR